MFDNCRDSDKGFALAGTIIFMVSVGLMISGVFILGVSEFRQGRSAVLVEQAFRSSEKGLATLAGSLPNGVYLGASGSGLQRNGASDFGRYEAVLVPSGVHHSLIRSVGYSPEGLARQEFGMLLEHRSPDLGGSVAALTILNELVAGPGLMASGFDAGSGAVACAAPGDVAGVRVASTSRRDSMSCAGCFEGAPSVSVDSSIGDPTVASSFNLLSSAADKALLGGTLGLIGPSYLPSGECDLGDVSNWGDSRVAGGPCGSYLPVIYSKDNLKIVGGSGQGVLLVDGDLELTGGFEFSGVVVVKGDLTIGDSGARIFGTVIAETAFFPQNPVSLGPFVLFSSCAVKRALEAHLVAQPLKQRSWVALY